MDNDQILYFDGNSARSLQVRVLIFQDLVHIHNVDDHAFYHSYPTAGVWKNTIGNQQYLYLDKSGNRYLQYSLENPFATVVSQEIDDKSKGLFNNLLKQKAIVLIPLFLGLAVGLYFLVVTLIPIIGMKVIGESQEIALGEKLKQGMLSEESMVGHTIDKTGTKKLQAFADMLQLSEKYPIKITVINSKIINAYALPGGNIVVYKGIINKIKTADELAALLAHESTHVNKRHSLRSILRGTSNAILISIIFGDASGVSGALAAQAETLNGLRYSRSLEKEADQEGMKLMANNKVNVSGMKGLMQRLQEEEKLPESFAFLVATQ